MVGVVPVEAGVGEEDPVLEAPAGGDRVLGEVGHAVEGVVEADPVPVDRGGPGSLVLEVDEDGGVLVHVDEGSRVLPVEAVHDVVAAVDGAADPAGDQVEGLPVLEPHDLRGNGVRERLVRRRPGQERQRLRPQVAEPRDHGRLREHGRVRPGGLAGRRSVPHRRVVHRAVVHGEGGALAGAGHRDHEVVVGQDPGGRRGPAEREPAGAALDVRRGLGADQDHELVEGDGAEAGEGPVADLSQPHHRVHDGGRRPGDVGAVVPERTGLGEPLDLEVEPVALAAVAGHRDAEGARVPAQEGGAAGGSEVRRRVEGDAVEAGGAPVGSVGGWGRFLGCAGTRHYQEDRGRNGQPETLHARSHDPSLPTTECGSYGSGGPGHEADPRSVFRPPPAGCAGLKTGAPRSC